MGVGVGKESRQGSDATPRACAWRMTAESPRRVPPASGAPRSTHCGGSSISSEIGRIATNASQTGRQALQVWKDRRSNRGGTSARSGINRAATRMIAACADTNRFIIATAARRTARADERFHEERDGGQLGKCIFLETDGSIGQPSPSDARHYVPSEQPSPRPRLDVGGTIASVPHAAGISSPTTAHRNSRVMTMMVWPVGKTHTSGRRRGVIIAAVPILKPNPTQKAARPPRAEYAS